MVNQFTRLRDGDRFFYLNEHWSSAELSILRRGDTLAKVIEANTGITNLQSDVFFFKASINGAVVSDKRGSGPEAISVNGSGDRASSAKGLSGVTVELESASGNVLATAVTNSTGRYSFDQFNGVSATGDYTVRIDVPSGFTPASVSFLTILSSRGGMHVSGVDFVVTPAR
jgi:hypothetical protein